ncbi:hypothetical protein OIM90_05320 [Streptomyces sp. AD16]|nr:hypothetical protein OIM90_05320 [Streptomyces sp. AD16]
MAPRDHATDRAAAFCEPERRRPRWRCSPDAPELAAPRSAAATR